jgi:transposase
LHGLGPDTGPALSRAAKQLETLVTPEGAALPPNTLDEIRRDLARLAVVREQIEAIERDRLARLQQAPQSRSNAMFALLAGVVGVGIETADMLVQRSCRDRCETVEPRRATPA